MVEPPVHPYRQQVLRFTRAVAADLMQGRCPPPQVEILAPFPTSLGPDERLWGCGPYRWQEFRALGDGTYEHDSSFFFATGGFGLAATALFAGGQAAGNNRRRRAAAAAAVPRWVDVEAGTVFLSRHGLYFHIYKGVFPWPWSRIVMADMAGPEVLQFTAVYAHGQQQVLLVTEWAELIFIMWALSQHPRHPRVIDGSWFPGGWHWDNGAKALPG